MPLYQDHVLPCLVNLACSARPVMEQRRKLVPLARGRVLEVGIGTGINLPLYDRAQVECVIGLEPSRGMLRRAARRLQGSPVAVELVDAGAESIPLASASIDTVLLTYTLCSIAQWLQALDEMRRVLKPGGQLIFCEHGAAPEPGVLAWQHRLNPLWRRIAGGCNLDRHIPAALENRGFHIQQLESAYLPHTPRTLGYNYWGRCVPAGCHSLPLTATAAPATPGGESNPESGTP